MTIAAKTIPPRQGARRRGRTPELPIGPLQIGQGTYRPEPDRPDFEQAFKNIDDVLRKEAGCTTELDYTEQTSWLLFLKYLDGLEQDKAMEAELDGKKYTFILDEPYRWESWAAPKGRDRKLDHNKAMTGDDLRSKAFSLSPRLHAEGQRAEHDRIQDRADFRRDQKQDL
jgi:HsdM N-terminal domain